MRWDVFMSSPWTTARRKDTRRPIAWRSAGPEARGCPTFPRGTHHVRPFALDAQALIGCSLHQLAPNWLSLRFGLLGLPRQNSQLTRPDNSPFQANPSDPERPQNKKTTLKHPPNVPSQTYSACKCNIFPLDHRPQTRILIYLLLYP